MGGWSSPEAVRQRAYRLAPHGRYLKSRGRSGVKATLLDQPICAIDGEGKSRPDGSHDYTLLAASWDGGKAAISGPALSTQQCFDFLMALPEHHTYVIYGGNYDANMMLKMLPKKVIDLLLDTGRAYWKKYRIR